MNLHKYHEVNKVLPPEVNSASILHVFLSRLLEDSHVLNFTAF